jgi:ABC-type polysaccharide/polyol phosphate export permease
MSSVTELARSRDLMVNLTLRELRGKYKRSLLGWSWSLLNPLASMLVFTVVFRYFLGVKIPAGDPSGMNNFAFYLLCGLLPWNFLANSISGSMGVLVANSNLIKKVYFPREVLVAANVASWVVALLLELGVLAVALLLGGNVVVPWLVPTLFLVAVQTVFVTGVSLVLSVLNVYFRDIQHLVGILLQMWFYGTPIVYSVDEVPGGLRFLYEINPMVGFVEAYRDCLYDLRFPPLLDTAYLVAVAAASLALGLFVFSRLEPKLAEEL